ncbi:MAG: chromate efflux transporter [Bernardetiaceae bacterium]|nr:chromate efflux transporter [Bernardetiaceae bacterium]
MSKRELFFLRDVLWVTLSAFGGPQAHLALYLDVLVRKRGYLTEAELMEINSLCQLLPGPSSTQTLAAIAYRKGGLRLAAFAMAIWTLPALAIVTLFALVVTFWQPTTDLEGTLAFARFIKPMAVGFVAVAAWRISGKLVNNWLDGALMAAAALAAYWVRSPWVFPIVLVVAGTITAFKYREQKKEQKAPFQIRWRYLVIYAAFFVAIAGLGALTRTRPVLLLENFYRNGSLVFGGGQVLTPMLYTEFVEFKKKRYLTKEEFLAGYAVVQAVPGPVFSFAGYVGGLSLRQGGPWGVVLGSVVATVGINLPGLLLVLFLIQFWDQLKRYRAVRASLEGINAASAGLVVAVALMLLQQLELIWLNGLAVVGTAAVLLFTRLPPPVIVVVGLAAGLLWPR